MLKAQSLGGDKQEAEYGVLTNVFVEFGHEGLAEAGDLRDGATLGVEVSPSLAPSHGQGCQTVLEDLLKAQELDDA